MFYELFPIFSVRRQKTKKGGSRSFQNGFRLALFPISEYIVQSLVHCGFQALFHDPEQFRFQ